MQGRCSVSSATLNGNFNSTPAHSLTVAASPEVSQSAFGGRGAGRGELDVEVPGVAGGTVVEVTLNAEVTVDVEVVVDTEVTGISEVTVGVEVADIVEVTVDTEVIVKEGLPARSTLWP